MLASQHSQGWPKIECKLPISQPNSVTPLVLLFKGSLSGSLRVCKNGSTWTSVVLSLPEKVFKFALNATMDTLPCNKNLCLWRKLPSPSCPLCGQDQSLLHILNHCPVALRERRYNKRHDAVLACITTFLTDHLSESLALIADLPGANYSFPLQWLTLIRDIVMWDSSKVHLVELTVPFEIGLEEANQRKATKYADPVASCRDNGYTTTLTTIQVSSRGFLHRLSLDNLYKLVKAPLNHKTALEKQLIARAITGSFAIWCSRNLPS